MIVDVMCSCHDPQTPRFTPACERRRQRCPHCGIVGAHQREVIVVLSPRREGAAA
jgi:hypothetical protein